VELGDLPRLGNVQGYRDWRNPVRVLDANGTATVFRRIAVQVRPVRDDNSPLGNWIDENAIFKQLAPNVPRLSGYQIRRHLYFGAAPDYRHLAVATTKGGMHSLL